MRRSSPDPRPAFIARSLLIAAGSAFAVESLVFNAPLVRAVVARLCAALGTPPPLIAGTEVVRAQVSLGAFALLLFFWSWLAGRHPTLEHWHRRPSVEKALLTVLALVVPFVSLELACRPFVPSRSKTTSLFVRDDVLGWRMRPNTSQPWGGVSVHTNDRGLRGPTVRDLRRPGTFRILYLGDSVTFGYGLTDEQAAYPHRVESALEARWKDRRVEGTAIDVETVNAGVGGYSPWQELAYLRREGARYRPDLVVVGFVLNDVTEKFHLVRFGGDDESYQLVNSYYSRLDRILSKSALVYELQNLGRKLRARRRLGTDLRLGAIRQQRLDVEALIESPERAGAAEAWRITLGNVDGIADWCENHNADLLLVAFPFRSQLSGGPTAPQDTLAAYAARSRVEYLDLLPLLRAMVEDGAAVDSLYLDDDHLTGAGSRVVGRAVAGRIDQNVNPTVR